MKTNYIIIILLCFLSAAQAQDECPSFKMGKRKINLRFVPKFKKKEVQLKFTPAIIIGAIPAFGSSSYSTNGKDTTQTSSSSGGNTDLQGTYGGFIYQFSLEKLLGKKSTLEYSLAYESLYRYSYPDTAHIKYPTVNMRQYYGAHGENTKDSYDEVESNNIRFGLQYRYYFFKKVYKGLYIAPQVLFSVGQNKYHDLDENTNNINFKYKQFNLVLNIGAITGYQFIIKKHFVLDFTTGLVYKKGIDFARKYADARANDVDLKIKYPNTSALTQHYSTAFFFGIGFGYKFL